MAYDEFGLFQENAEEFGLPWSGPPDVRRTAVEVEPGRALSALVWGTGVPELVLLHGGAQNAHTWDTVALALDRPLVAIDLPGHGHSDPRDDGPFGPVQNAGDVAVAVRELAPDAPIVVGMSLGGLTAIALGAREPGLVRKLTLVDVTPGVDRDKAAPIAAFIAGPESFESFDEILARTIEFNPTRTESSLRRGVLHNAVEREDGRWVWRYQRPRLIETAEMPDFGVLWDDVSKLEMPLMLAHGAESGVVGDEDVAELRRRRPDVRVEPVAGAGHSIQGDRPVELAGLLADFLER
ncbi:MAG TPA: alpha/beta hydrolase [Acidimicrobiia bacterium]|nr:alpha/beta hydrolase [Acidimicrobiia bacterium]